VPPVCSAHDVLAMKEDVKKVHVSDALLGYVQEIIGLTRKEERFALGASPRAFLHLLDASRAKAYLSGRDYAKPDDVKAVVTQVLHHRLQLTQEARLHREDTDRLIRDLVIRAHLPV